MVGSLTDIYAALNVIGQALNTLVNTTSSAEAANATTISSAILQVFPHTTASSSTVSAGTITFSSSLASGFMIVQTSSGATVKIPFYPP